MSSTGIPPGAVTRQVPTRPHDTWAEWYDIVYEACFGDTFAWLTEATLNSIRTTATSGARIIDFGAGTGRLAIPLAREGFRVHAVEASAPMLAQLVSKSSRELTPDAITTEHRDIQSYAGLGEFDVALCVFTVLIYITTASELRAALRAISDTLRPGGRLLIDLPDPSVFASFTANTPDVFRIVRITPDPPHAQTEPGTGFTFDEETLMKAPHLRRYHDRFPVRYWPPEVVRDYASACGLKVVTDLSAAFARAASTYWWLEKTSEALPENQRHDLPDKSVRSAEWRHAPFQKVPKIGPSRATGWAIVDLNHGPQSYQDCALTT